jgi:hypothetical protein
MLSGCVLIGSGGERNRGMTARRWYYYPTMRLYSRVHVQPNVPPNVPPHKMLKLSDWP